VNPERPRSPAKAGPTLAGKGDREDLADVAAPRRGKARFDYAYNQPDPRAYFQALKGLEYQIPAHGQRVFAALLELLRRDTGREELVVLDLCCSYGINSALLNHDLDLDALYQRYCAAELTSLSAEELVDSDIKFYNAHRRKPSSRVIGIDTATNAVAYARRVGLVTAGFEENLEERDPGETLRGHIRTLDLITVTGGVSYIGERTFERVLATASGRAPWMAAFCLRMSNYAPIAAVAARHGLVTEKLVGYTFPQRRFVDDAERSYVMRELEKLRVDPTGKEADGFYHAELYLSRPRAQGGRTSLEELLAPQLIVGEVPRPPGGAERPA
jgi:SAM-dependent methyltransferase